MKIGIKKILYALSFGTFMVSWFWSGNLAGSYVYRIKEPNISTGEIVPFHIKGVTVYITKQDMSFLNTLDLISGLSFIAVAIFLVLNLGKKFEDY